MSEPDEQHARLEQIQEHIDEAKATAQHLADERVINPEDVEDRELPTTHHRRAAEPSRHLLAPFSCPGAAVGRVGGDQFVVRTPGRDHAVVDHQHLVGQSQRGKAMSDDNGGPARFQSNQHLTHQIVGRGRVQVLGGLVHQQHASSGDERTGQEQAAANAAGEQVGARALTGSGRIAHDDVQTVLGTVAQAIDPVAQTGALQRRDQVGVRRVL